MEHHDYIFTGSGLSALMTVYEMLLSGNFENKSILLIDELETKVKSGEANSKKTNDEELNSMRKLEKLK